MNTLCLVGAGQLGSRHLQALKRVKRPLSISVVDPSPDSLRVAEERYLSLPPAEARQDVRYLTEMPRNEGAMDLAIVATTSRDRRRALEALLTAAGQVRYFLLEKILFQRLEDYKAVGESLRKSGAAAWVNCSMRTMPFYRDMRGKVGPGPLRYAVTGGQFGLVTNAIHYVDHLSYLSGCRDFEVDTTGLDPRPVPSKRKGFLELNGTLNVRFSDGSSGSFTCFSSGTLPVMVDVSSPTYKCVTHEALGLARVAKETEGWKWQEVPAPIPFQSQMTTDVVEDILEKGTCSLVSTQASFEDHVVLHRALEAFLVGKCGRSAGELPFT